MMATKMTTAVTIAAAPRVGWPAPRLLVEATRPSCRVLPSESDRTARFECTSIAAAVAGTEWWALPSLPTLAVRSQGKPNSTITNQYHAKPRTQ